MENTNNSSTYDEMTENKTENQTEGFLYSSEQAETEKPVQQAVSLDKNTEAEAVQNSETSTDPNPNVTLETNAAPELNASMQMNPVENPNLNPNPGVNPNMNSSYNPNLNPNMNSSYNPNLNPNMNNGYTPNLNPNMNQNMNQNINGGYNANMNPNLNQNVSGGYNANMNMNPNMNMNGGYNPNMNMNPNMYQGVPNYNQPKKEVADYTSKFDEKDRSENKIYAMLAYLLGIVGIIIALLAAKKSDYVQFHVRQSIKLTVCSALLGIIMIPFAVLSLIPFVGIVFGIVVTLIAIAQLGIYILRIVAFAQVCSGKAKEPAIVGELKMFN